MLHSAKWLRSGLGSCRSAIELRPRPVHFRLCAPQSSHRHWRISTSDPRTKVHRRDATKRLEKGGVRERGGRWSGHRLRLVKAKSMSPDCRSPRSREGMTSPPRNFNLFGQFAALEVEPKGGGSRSHFQQLLWAFSKILLSTDSADLSIMNRTPRMRWQLHEEGQSRHERTIRQLPGREARSGLRPRG